MKNANKARKEPLRVILNGLGKDAAQIISRINGFTYVQTQFDYYTSELKIVREIRYSEGERANVRCYGADDVREGVAIMHHEGVDVSITGNSTNPTRFQHPVAGTYKKECIEQGKKYYDALQAVHDVVKGGVKVTKSIGLVMEISEIYVENYQKMLSDENYTPDELAAISSGYAMLIDESSDVLQDLKNVVNVTGMSLSDAERLAIIDNAYRSLMNYRNLVRYYTGKTISVSYLRARKKNDMDRVMSLYGTANERYW